jgi:hypothetical protein
MLPSQGATRERECESARNAGVDATESVLRTCVAPARPVAGFALRRAVSAALWALWGDKLLDGPEPDPAPRKATNDV